VADSGHRGSGTDEVRLRDGTRLVVRPIAPADAGALVALHARLSADTIYRRYFGAPAPVARRRRDDEPSKERRSRGLRASSARSLPS
jgi:hypothetical protein